MSRTSSWVKPTTVAVEMELAGVGGGWTDVSADLSGEDIVLDYGIRSSAPQDRVAGTGFLQFGLRNGTNNSGGTLGYYSPYSASKRGGFNFSIRSRLKLVYGGNTIYWMGRLRKIDPDPDPFGSRVTACTAVDWMDEASRQNLAVTLGNSVRSDEAFSALVASVPLAPASTSVDTGSDTYVYAFDNLWSQAKVYSAFADLARSELGYIGQKRNATNGQTAFFESRHTRPTISSILVTLDKTMHGLDIINSADDILTHTRVTVYPRRKDSGATTIVAMLPGIPTGTLAPGQSQDIFLNYTDPIQRDSFIGAINVVTPLVATTDYTMNTAADGSGTNLTASFTVTASVFASSIKLVVANVGTQAGYVTKLQVRGDGVYAQNPVIGEYKNTAAIVTYGDNIADIDMPYQTDPNFAYNAAQYIGKLYASPFANVRGVSFCGNLSATLMQAAIFGEISNKVALVATVPGILASQNFYINAVKLAISERNEINCTWQLVPADIVKYWQLGVSGASELGAASTLAL